MPGSVPAGMPEKKATNAAKPPRPTADADDGKTYVRPRA